MVKWKDLWLTRKDSNDVIIGLWATKRDANYARCSLCSFDLKYSTQGFQNLLFSQSSNITRMYQKEVLERIKRKIHFIQLPCQRLCLDRH